MSAMTRRCAAITAAAMLVVGLLPTSAAAGYVSPAADQEDSTPPALIVRNEGPTQVQPVAISIPQGGGLGESAGDPSIGLRDILGMADAPSQATEVAALRSEKTKTVANPDGTFTFVSSMGRINYRDPKGDWQPIDLSLVPATDGAFDLAVKANDRAVRFATDGRAGQQVELVADSHVLRLSLPAARRSGR
jgi:hypothetical protein